MRPRLDRPRSGFTHTRGGADVVEPATLILAARTGLPDRT